MKVFKVFCLFLLFIVVSSDEEEADNIVENVEFTSHVTDTLIESAENASIVSADEVEHHVFHDQESLISPVLDFDTNSTHLLQQNVSILTNESITVQITEGNTTVNTTDAKSKMRVECAPRVIPDDEVPTVTLANSSVLLKVLAPAANKNATVGECVVVLFYSNQCVFSARMAPHFNALPRVFPDIAFYAVDVIETGNLYVRYGLVYVPNVMLFHNSKPFARYNETVLNLEQFVKFINKFTALSHNGTLNVTSADMNGPVPSTLTKKLDYILVLAWAFTLCSLCFGFAKSSVFKKVVEFCRNTWYEANASTQHEHEE
ncbi:thioredoxin domain-containing protein 15 [Caerostris darwini]|uniref:Thioredoxin domain-containing protein 15 n=1 Tax=Caerostris darwini TaxID=1538125 RepID=A0AAV4PP65_9ARAC|nr:thioredoxin domain-containing protein 15 [Caerostris darwini]